MNTEQLSPLQKARSDQALTKLRGILNDFFVGEEVLFTHITRDTKLTELGVEFDSLDEVELIMALEDEYDIELPEALIQDRIPKHATTSI